jgi:copper oxidase (laccase) domain-containing protein
MEVGDEVAALFDPASMVGTHLDARADAQRRLVAAGVAVEHVDVCTRCDPRCFSHRGDGGATGRQALLVRRS